MSIEQQNIVQSLRTSHTVVDAVAGSGKTTTIISIVNTFDDVLVLTFNARLRMETRQRTVHANVHTFHSYARAYYDDNARFDEHLHTITKDNVGLKKFPKCSLLVLDEAQDLTPLLIQFVRKVLVDLRGSVRVCVLGDRMQCLYKSRGASAKILETPECLLPNAEWSRCDLRVTHRLTDTIASFVNACVLHEQRMLAVRQSSVRPVYICTDLYDTPNVFTLLSSHVSEWSDVLVLCRSLQSSSRALVAFEKYLCQLGIRTHVFAGDVDSAAGVTFATYHGSKGLTFSTTIVFGFDDSDKHACVRICPNEIYVACTRASKQLILLQDYRRGTLPFFDMEKSLTLATVIQTHCKSPYAESISFAPLRSLRKQCSFFDYLCAKEKIFQVATFDCDSVNASECELELSAIEHEIVVAHARWKLHPHNLEKLSTNECEGSLAYWKTLMLQEKFHRDRMFECVWNAQGKKPDLLSDVSLANIEKVCAQVMARFPFEDVQSDVRVSRNDLYVDIDILANDGSFVIMLAPDLTQFSLEHRLLLLGVHWIRQRECRYVMLNPLTGMYVTMTLHKKKYKFSRLFTSE